MIGPAELEKYNELGYLHIPGVFADAEMDALDADLAVLLRAWAQTDMGWNGPWRKAYMDSETEKKSKLTHLHDLHLYSAAWCRAVTSRKLGAALGVLLNASVELHHTTLHIKPPSTGHPFPMHQDFPFYPHTDERYIDVLVHLDDTCHENGEIRFLPGSHKTGYLLHITETEAGECSPHLPTHTYRLEDTIAVPAKRGDVVCFNILTVHGSYINTTDQPRRLVRCGYRDPENEQTSGQSCGRPGLMVHGTRPRGNAPGPFSTEIIPQPAAVSEVE